MLTEEGYRDRFWQGYPHLRQLLEQKDDPIPHGIGLFGLVDDDAQRVSTDHGPLGRLADLLAIARRVASGNSKVQEAMYADAALADELTAEVSQLLRETENRFNTFRDALNRACDRELEVIRAVTADIREVSLRPQSNRVAVLRLRGATRCKLPAARLPTSYRGGHLDPQR